ncbi:MAG: hypothetical protein E6X21_10880 [Clostridium sp.]|nr:hypothetical protein [Clostridium sp.]
MKSEKFGGDLVVAKDLKLGGLVKSNFSEELRVRRGFGCCEGFEVR